MTTDPSLHDLSHVYRHGDRVSVTILWLAAAGSLALSAWHSTWFLWLLVALPAALVPTLLGRLAPGALVTRLAVGVAFMVLSAVTIHQARGMVEFHFSIFVLLAFLLVYRDWRPIILASAVIAVHHLSFHYFQMADMGVYAFDHMGLHVVFIHAAFVVFEAIVLIYLSVMMRAEAVQGIELSQIAQRLHGDDGEVDLRYRVPATRSAVTAGLHNSLDSLQATLRRIDEAFRTLGDLGDALRRDSESAARESGEQSSRTTELSTAVTQMSTSIHEVAGNTAGMAQATEDADALLARLRDTVTGASHVIHNLEGRLSGASDQVHRLEEQGRNIGVVMGVIRDVAERTNLLALNAAIEAARAGEHGRGFAVVADEVRNLARQTQSSAGEIEQLIAALQDETRQSAAAMREGAGEASSGARQMSKAAEAVDAAIERVSRIAGTSGQIASSTAEQSQVAEEIDRRLHTIDDLAARNRERADQGAQRALDLARMLADVQGQLRQFRI